MFAGLIGVLVAEVGLIPSKISALGIDFTGLEQANLLKLLFGITIYYIITFAIYSISELSASKLSESEETISSIPEQVNSNILLKLLSPDTGEKHDIQEIKSGLLSLCRSLYEVLIPLIWGMYAVYVLYKVMYP
jgi:hypothetical protein